MARARMNPAPTREEMHAYRLAVMEECNGLVAELHDAGFSMLLVESVQITDDSNMWQRVVIDNTALGWDQLDRIKGIAAMRSAKVILADRPEGSRIVLWPNVTAES